MAIVEDLYKKLSEGGYYTKTLGEFETQLNDPEYRKKVHSVVTRDGIEDTDFETFDLKYTPLKKKEESDLPSMASETSGSLATPEMGTQEPLESSSSESNPVIPNPTPDAPEIDVMEEIPVSRTVEITTTEKTGGLFKKKKKKEEKEQKSFLTKEEKKGGEALQKENLELFQKWENQRNQEILEKNIIEGNFGGGGDTYTYDTPEGRSLVTYGKEVTVTAPEEKKRKFKDKFEEFYYTYMYPMGKSKNMREYFRLLKENRNNPDFKNFLEYAVNEDSIFKDARNNINYEIFRSGEATAANLLNGTLARYGYDVQQSTIGEDWVTITSPGKQKIQLKTNVIGGNEQAKKLLEFVYDTWRDEKEIRYIFDKDINNLYEDGEQGRKKYFDDIIDFALTDINKFKNLIDEDVFQYEIETRSKDFSIEMDDLEFAVDKFNTKYEEFNNALSTRNNFITTYNDLLNKYKKSGKKDLEAEAALKSYYQSIQNLDKTYDFEKLKTDLEKEQFILQERKSVLEEKYKNIDEISTAITKALPLQYADREKQGSFLGMILTSAIKGPSNMFQTITSLSAESMLGLGASVFGMENLMPPDEYEKYKDEGMSDYQIYDKSLKRFKKDLFKSFNNLGEIYFDTTEEYMQSPDRTTFENVVSSVVSSASSAVSGPWGTGFFASSYADAEELMSGEEYDNMSELEKKIYIIPYTLAIGGLERFGFNVLSGANKSLTNRFVNNLLGRAITKLPKGASLEAIKHEINKELSSIIITGGADYLLSATAEGVVEGTQSIADTSIKNIVNAIYEKEIFKDVPDLTTYDGVIKALDQAGNDAYMGTLGGLMFGAIANSFNIIKQKKFTSESPELFDEYEKLLKNNTTLKNVENLIKIKVNEGSITKEEGLEVLESIKECQQLINVIPDNLSADDAKNSFNLLLEKKNLEQEIAGKDEALTTGQRERIEQINNELKTISKNAIEESTKQQQEGTAEGGVVQREGVDQGQPQVGQGERAVGETTQPEANISDSSVTGGGVQETEVVDVEAQKADIETRRQEELNTYTEEGLKETYEVNNDQTVEEAVNAKYDAEIAALEETVAQQPVAEEVVIDKPTIATNSSQELERVKATTPEEDNGATFNLDGTVYDGAGLVVPVVSINTTVEEATPEMIADFVEQHADKIGDNETVKVGIYKFPNSNEMSIDLNVVAPESSREQAIEFGKLADQESLYDLSSGQNVKTGGTGKNPMQFSGNQFKEIAKALKEGRLPNVFEQATPSQSSMGTVISGTDVEIDNQAKKIAKPRMTKIVANAAKAVSRILPNTKFIVHDTQESFTAATGDVESGGYFNPATGEIHINLEKANARTVAHEVFHAVLLNAVKTDANAAATTRKMIEAISKKIDNNPKLKKYLDKFLSQYEENIQNEEKAAEFVGVLAEKMSTFSGSIKDVIKRWLDRIAKSFGLNPFNTNEIYDVLNTIARKTTKGIEITESDVKIIEDVNNGTLFENEYVHTNGTVVSTPSARKSKFKNTVVKESDIISTKEVEGKPLEVVYYDNFTSSPYQLKNRKSGSVIERQGEGGPGYSYRKEVKAAGIVAAFTNVTKGLNLIQGVRSRNNIAKEPAVVGVALQNKETGHLGNLTTARDFYSPTDGVIAQAVNDGLITEADAVTMLKGAVKAYESTKKGQSKESSLGFKAEDFNTLDEFYNRINDISFERRGTFNDNVIPLKADLKITKATRPYVSTWIDAGIPTLNEYYEATTEQYTKEAQAHDIVKYLDPNLDKIGISSDIPVSDAEVKRAAEMGVEIVQVDDALTHTSYPVVLFGNNIGIPSTFNSVREMAEDWNVPNPFFKAGRRKDTAEPVRVPELKETGRKPAPRKQKSLPKEVADKLTEDGKGNYIFHHYSGKRRETIQPRSGDNIITSREEAAALSSVGGVAQFYTQEGQKEAGVGPVLHTIVVPKDKVYYLQNDVENFYAEAKRQFLEVRPGQAFNANYQAAWIGKVAADNGYDMLVSNWRGDQLRAQTVKELTPIEENLPFKEREANVYKVGDEVIVYGGKAIITSMDGTVATFKGERMSGSIDTDRNANLITKVRRQKSLKDDKTLKIIDKNKKYIEDRTKKTTAKGTWRKYLQKFENRQSDIKRSISGIDSVYSRRAYDLLVDKAGASGWADERFKEADKKIYKGLSIKDLDILNAMIYAKRIIAINKNRAERGMKPYTGMDGYSTSDAEQSLKNYKESYGDKKYADFENRTKEYFKVYEENLKEAYESGRITEQVYNMLKDIDYSPIRTLKYIIGDEAKTAEEIDRLSSIIGMKSDQIEKLGDINENEFVSDTRYLLMASINASSKKGFENRLLNAVFDTFENANDSETFDIMEEFYEYNPVVGTRKDGSLIHKYDKEKIPHGYKEVVFYKDGVKRKMVMKSKYADQLLDLIKVGEGWKTAGKLSGGTLLRFFATSGNPLFILGNVPADFSNILFISDVYGKIKPIGAVRLAFDFVKNFLRSTTTIKLKEIKREYLKHGGSMSYMAADGVRNLQSKVAKYKVLTYPQKALVAYGKTMSYLGEKSEEAFRLAVYEKTKSDLIKKYKKENNGLDPQGQDLEDIMYASVREAREVIDFNQGGEWAKNADTVAPYFNAGMQGFRRIREYAAKKPVAFASSMVQAATMAGGIAAYSIAALMSSACAEAEDEDDCNKKMMGALNSLSEYEKSNYHIIFTGKKDENGEYEYIRIKKLPGLSVVTTYAEQLFTKFFFSSRGVDYDPNNATMTNAIKSSLPFDPTGIVGRNPLVSGAVAYMGFDLFKWEETFKKPRGWEDRVIKSEVEGINDDNVNSLFKSIAPMLHMSPARTQAMVEKLITSESTNPTISILYAVANGLFGEGSDLKESFSLATDELIKNTSRKLVRTTNKKLLEYAEQDKIAEREIEENSDEYVNTTKMYDDIKDIYDSGKTLTNGQLIDMIMETFEPATKSELRSYFNKYNNYIRNRSLDKRLLNIVFENKPKLQALYLYERYGTSLEKEEIDELNTIMKQTGSKIPEVTLIYYNKNYYKK